MAIRERVYQLLGVRPQTIVADDGIVLQIPPVEGGLPGAGLITFDAAEISSLVRSRIETTALFAARFRECAARALLMPAARPGRRTPLWLQRVKAGQLLEASRQFQDFPVSVEAARECLQQYYDLPALTDLMERLASGRVRVVEAVTSEPSPFAHPLLFGYASTLIYQEDLPHAERRAQLLSLDPKALDALLGDGGVAELLDDEVLAQVEAELQHLAPGRRVRADAERIADLLRELGPLSAAELAERCTDVDQRDPGEDARAYGADGAGGDVERAVEHSVGQAVERETEHTVERALAELAGARRATTVRVGGRELWARVEDVPALRRALGAEVPDWALERVGAGGAVERRAAARSPLNDLLLRYARTHTTVTPQRVARAFGLGAAEAEGALAELAGAGSLVDLGAAGWMEPAALARVRHRSLARARAAIAPAPPAALQRLVLERAGLDEPGGGVDTLAQALAALEGVWLPAGLWESVVLPARVADYRPAMLDELIAAGEVVWQARPVGDAASRSGSARARAGTDDVPAPGEIAFFPTDSALAPIAGEAIAPGEPEAPAGRQTGVTGEGLWQLVREGAATGRSFEPVRRALAPAAGPRTAPPSRRVRSRRGRRLMMEMPHAGDVTAAGRLSLVVGSTSWVRLSGAPAGDEERAIAQVESLLDRYGVVCRDLALAFGAVGGLGPLMPVLRRMEETGMILRGSFIEGLGPTQFAERESIDRLRSLSHGPGGATETPVVLDLKDPACLVGRGVRWPEPALPAGLGESAGGHGEETGGPPVRRQGASVVVLGGAPVLYASENLKVLISYTSEREELARALAALAADRQRMLAYQGAAAVRRRTVVESLNGVTSLEPAVSDLLRQAGFVRDPKGMRLAVGPHGATWR